MMHLHRWLLRGVLVVVARPKLTLLASAMVLIASIVLSLHYLRVDTDQDKLFSPHVQFFRDYLAFEDKFPENEALYVLIESADKAKPPPTERWTACADELTAKLSAMKKIVAHAECKAPLDQLGRASLLFEDYDKLPGDLKDAQEKLVPLARMWGGRPNALIARAAPTPMQRFLSGVLLASPDAETAQFLQVLANGWTQTLAHPEASPVVGGQVPDLPALQADNPRDLGYSYVRDESDHTQSLLLVAVYLNDSDNSMAAGEEQVDAIRQTSARIEKQYPEFHIGVTGRPALDADEMATSDRDSTRAETIAMIVVFAGLAFTLRSLWLALAAEISLAVAIGWTFGWATISLGELNLLSLVFLITLIGIGMDYLVQILTRYRREARRYVRADAIWTRVFRHVSPPIFTACLGAAGAFLVAIFTDFRGAAELGIIAGGGLLLCLLSGYTVLPALLVLFPAKLEPIDPELRYARPSRPRSPIRRLFAPALWVVALAVIVPFANRTYFNPNLLDMQSKGLASVKLVRKLQAWSAVVMSRDLSMLRKVKDAVGSSPLVASTESLIGAQDNAAWLSAHASEVPRVDWTEPSPLQAEDVRNIMPMAQRLARKYQAYPQTSEAMVQWAKALADAPEPSGAMALSRWQVAFFDELRGLLANFTPPPLDVTKLPGELRAHLVSADGYYALYINPANNLWKREPLEAFVNDIEARADTIPNHPPVTGIAPEIYHSTRAIERSFYKATAYALMLVVFLVYLDLRNVRETLITISVLALGLPMLVGLMGLLGVKWNFANFFGLPILIGAGHEYGVFMMHRYREVRHNPRRVWGRWDVSDRALLLCAFVTSSSFTFFWLLGSHEGLRSLGLVMALGTASIYLAALLVVRPLLKWKLDRRPPPIR